MKKNNIQDIWERIDIKGPDECWPWKLSCGNGNVRQYGQFTCDGKTWIAHRAAYYAFTGIHPGKYRVCHTCDNPPCCNPKHLFLGTAKDNAEDRNKKGRTAKGIKKPNSKLNDYLVREIKYLLQENNFSNIEIARLARCNPGLVLHIKKGRSWTHIST